MAAVRVSHTVRYKFGEPVELGPQVVRLRPRRDDVIEYSMAVRPTRHAIMWRQDILENYEARVLFPLPVSDLEIHVEFMVGTFAPRPPDHPRMPELVALTEHISRSTRHVPRLDSYVQAPSHTVESGTGSCRDMAWLLMEHLGAIGCQARFVSGYLLQPGRDGLDTAELHAWAEARVCGEWVGFDPTLGQMAGSNHIVLASAPHHADAVPIASAIMGHDVEFTSEISVERI